MIYSLINFTASDVRVFFFFFQLAAIEEAQKFRLVFRA